MPGDCTSGCFSAFPQMQGIQVESGISQFLRLCAKRMASIKSPMASLALAHSLRFIVAQIPLIAKCLYGQA